MKHELIQLRAQLALSRGSHELLERKFRVLAVQVSAAKAELDSRSAEADRAVTAAYDALEAAIHDDGRERVERARLPARCGDGRGGILPYPLAGTTAQMDAAYAAWQKAKQTLTALFDAQNHLHELSQKMHKARKRAAALEHQIIPAYAAKIKYIRIQLEERERDELIRLWRGAKR